MRFLGKLNVFRVIAYELGIRTGNWSKASDFSLMK